MVAVITVVTIITVVAPEETKRAGVTMGWGCNTLAWLGLNLS